MTTPRLDEIRAYWAKWSGAPCEEGSGRHSLAGQDIQWLLSRIEQMEKSLKETATALTDAQNGFVCEIRERAEEALTAIREKGTR